MCRTSLLFALLVAAACSGEVTTPSGGGDGGGDPPPSGAGATQRMSDVLCARKMALDLTHRSPTREELSQVESGALTLPALADRYLASDEFADVSFDWMRQEFPPTALTTAETDVQEPARLMHHVLLKDRDWREILTATYTIDPMGVEQPVTDGPAAGILSTRYSLQSTVGSYRRNWAARFERQFAGITLAAVTLPPGDTTDVSPDGIAKNAACAGCHVHPTYGIDDLARFAQCYGDDGLRIAGCSDPEASFLMQKGRGLVDLGRITASTNEFKSQSVNFFFKRLFGRDLAVQEAAFYTDAAKLFAQSGYRARALIKHLVTSEAYCSR